jgi:hypothetical protein
MTQLDIAFLEHFTDTIGPIGKSLGMLIRPTIDQLYLQERLDYNQLTGVLTWRYRPLQDFPDARAMKIWNTKYAGKRAGGVDTSDGYRTISVGGYREYEHRVIWVLMTGEIPDHVDHDNGVRTANWWSNLFDRTRLENNRNAGRPRHNTSGVVGVSRRAKDGRWFASISVGNKTRYLGLFVEMADAIAARRKAEAELGFHPNHGAAR